MDLDAQLAEALRPQQLGVDSIPAKVKAIDGLLADVETVDGMEVFEVRLCASETSQSYIKPKLESWVVISPLQGKDSYYVSAVTEIDEAVSVAGTAIELSCEESAVKIDKEGLLLSAKGENLFSVLNDTIEEVKKIIVVQGTGPNVAALQAIQDRAKKLLRDA